MTGAGTTAAELERDARRLDLDWVRIGAFGLLILYHVGMFYVSWDWHVKSPRVQTWLEPVMVATHPWRLPLLFLVSGAATRFMFDGFGATRRGAARLAGLRTWRLLPPILFGMFVVVPPQSWLQVAEALHRAPEAYGTFWPKYATSTGHWCDAKGCLATPTWNHLWFVVYLFVYTLDLCLLLAVWPRAAAVTQRWGERALAGWGVVVWPALGFIAVRMLLAPRFDATHALIGDWTVHGESLLPFAFGFLFAKSDAVWAVFVRRRWLLLGAGVAAYAAIAWATVAYPGDVVPPDGLRRLLRIAYGIDQWTTIGAVLGFARLHLATRDGPVRRYLTEAIFPFYIVHQTIIVCVAWWLAKRNLPLGLEAALVILATVAGCFATFEIVRRVAPLRPLFGLRWKLRTTPVGSRPRAPRGLAAAAAVRVDVC